MPKRCKTCCRAATADETRTGVKAFRTGRSLASTLVLMAALLAFVTPAAALRWSHYQNPRYGTEADIPSNFIADKAPGSGDGRVFRDPSGTGTIRVYAAYNVLSDSLAGYKNELIGYYRQDSVDITNQQNGANWFVLSGTKDGQVVYLLVKHAKGCSAQLLHHIEFRFPITAGATWNPIIERASQSLSGPCPD